MDHLRSNKDDTSDENIHTLCPANFNDLSRSIVFIIMASISLRDARRFSYTSKKIRSYFRIYQEHIGADENNNVNCKKCFNCIDCMSCYNCDNCDNCVECNDLVPECGGPRECIKCGKTLVLCCPGMACAKEGPPKKKIRIHK